MNDGAPPEPEESPIKVTRALIIWAVVFIALGLAGGLLMSAASLVK